MRFNNFLAALATATTIGTLLASPARAQTAVQAPVAQEVPKPKPKPKPKISNLGPSVDISSWRIFYNFDSHFEDVKGKFSLDPENRSSRPFFGNFVSRHNLGVQFSSPDIELMLGLSKSIHPSLSDLRRDRDYYEAEFGYATPASFPASNSDLVDAAVLAKVRELGLGIGLLAGARVSQEFNKDNSEHLSAKSPAPSRSLYGVDAGLIRGHLSGNHLKLLVGFDSQEAVTASKRSFWAANYGGYTAYYFLGKQDEINRVLVPWLSLSGSRNFYDDFEDFGIRIDGRLRLEFPLDDLVLQTRIIPTGQSPTASLADVNEVRSRNLGYGGQVILYVILGKNTIGKHLAEVVTFEYAGSSLSTRAITPGINPTDKTTAFYTRIGLGASVKF